MTLFFSPLPRMARRRMMERFFENDWPQVENEVGFPVDVQAEPEAFVVTALLPGLTPEDVSVQIVNETVTIQGEFKDDRDEKTEFILQERPTGKFSRVLTLPDALDASKVDASMENGILTLHISKAEDAKPRTIKVKGK